MATITYETLNPSIVPNTVMQKVYRDGVHSTYRIEPADGYVLHDKNYDDENVTPVVLGYRTSRASVVAAYDFTATTTIDGYTAYGSREFFARPASEVPENQIFGVTNTPEVM